MKTQVRLLALALATLSITSCSKDKRAAFTTDKDTYIQGETIKTTNTTVKGSKFYRWDFNGTELYEKEPIFVIPKDQAPGDFFITCEATNNKNSSSSGRASSKTITIIEAAEGKLIFWNPGNSFADIKITVWNTTMASRMDTITYSNSSNPNCSFSSFNAVFNGLKAGTYNYDAKDLNGTSTESGTIELIDGFDCKSVQIF